MADFKLDNGLKLNEGFPYTEIQIIKYYKEWRKDDMTP